MDPIKAEKLRAMKSYKKGQNFGYNFMFHSLIALTCTLLCSFPFWFPSSLSSSMNCFWFMSLPSIWSSFFNPKCLFVVVNVIVVFLVGESKFLGSSHSSQATDIYSEYVERSQSLKGRRQQSSSTTLQEKKEYKNLKDEYYYSGVVERVDDIINEVEVNEVEAKEDEVDEFEDCKEDDGDENNIAEDHHQQERDGEEEVGLPAEELNKRVEDFIAKVNKQRRLEESVYMQYY